jgi:hypothetical protein
LSDIAMDMVNAYLATFDEYEVRDPALQEALQALKGKMTQFARDNSDPMAFYGKFAESGLQEEYTALIEKVAMASLADERNAEGYGVDGAADGGAEDDGQDAGGAADGGQGPGGPGSDEMADSGRSTGDLGASGSMDSGRSAGDRRAGAGVDPLEISVRDYLAQYRVPYEEVKKAGYRKNGEKAYENLFAVADRTDNMLDAQIIIEEERLMWHIVKDDMLDVLRAGLEKVDPLQPAMNVALDKQIEVTEVADSAEELDYLLEKLEYDKIRLIAHAVTKMTLAAHIAVLLYTYCSSKMNTQVAGGQGKVGEGALRVMIAARDALRRTLHAMQRDFGMSFDDLLADESLKIWLLSPKNLDESGRTKTALNPKNYEAFREVVDEEILSDRSTIELLKRIPETAVWYGI